MAAVIEKYPMVSLITYIIGLFDPYGIDHSERVSALSERLGRLSGMKDSAALEDLALAGMLHDIGKLGVPESIRAKPGRLTEAEMFLMQQHPVIGLRILKRMNGSISPRVHKDIYHHHEDFDGGGYPDGLVGEAIPLGARILRICDYFDARTHVRGYSPQLTPYEAMEEMISGQRKRMKFDPRLLSLFLDMMTETRL